jgi:outer membrane immunogenic protein
MKKLFLATAAVVALSAGSAIAADLSRPVMKAPPVVRPACAQFGGFYVGIHGGGTYYDNKFKDLDNFGFGILGIDNIGGFTNTEYDWHAGVQAGYNWQWGCTLWGVQADWSWTGAEVNSLHTDFLDGGDGVLAHTSEAKWYGSLRTRGGIVVENVLLYVTGGVAFARFDRQLDVSTGAGAGLVAASFSSDRTRVGYVFGAGTEWSFAPNWSIVSEFLYMGFEKDAQTYTCPSVALCGGGAVGLPFRYEYDDTIISARIGLNYRFGGPAVVAKY